MPNNQQKFFFAPFGKTGRDEFFSTILGDPSDITLESEQALQKQGIDLSRVPRGVRAAIPASQLQVLKNDDGDLTDTDDGRVDPVDFGRFDTGFKSRFQIESERLGGLPQEVTPEREQDIFAAERARVQDAIDTVNELFASEFEEAAEEARGRRGSLRAIQAGAGLIGGSFAEAQKGRLGELSARVRRNITARKKQAVQTILQGVDERADRKIEAERTLALENREAFLDFLEKEQTDAREQVEVLGRTGMTVEELPDDVFRNMLEQTGYSEFEFQTILNDAQPDEQKIDFKFEFRNGKAFGTGFNPATNQLEFIEQDLPEGFEQVEGRYTEKVMPDGTLLFFPDEIDPTKPLDEQVIQFGAKGQFAKPKAPKSILKNDQLIALRASGISSEVANAIAEDILAGKDREEMIGELEQLGLGAETLDTFDRIVNITGLQASTQFNAGGGFNITIDDINKAIEQE